jgi:uncharacterized protein (TIGR00255 family)
MAEFANKKVTVEIKSLNSKQLDLSMKVDPQYRELEMEFRRMIASSLLRGKVDFNLTVEAKAGDMRSMLNVEVVKAYLDQVKTIYPNPQLSETIVASVLRMPNAVRQDNPTVDAAELQAVKAAVEEAIAHLVEFRKQEGKMLEKVFTAKILNIADLLASIEPYEKERVEKVKQDLLTKLENLSVQYDKNRFEQELIYYIEKLDINEEKHRLDNHLKYFRETLDADDPNGAGKKLGFIAQEMGREINTTGSKSNHAEMQRIVVKMKDELEQIKEQVLNVL